MNFDGSYLLIAVGAWAAYKLTCWWDARAAAKTTNHEVRSHDA